MFYGIMMQRTVSVGKHATRRLRDTDIQKREGMDFFMSTVPHHDHSGHSDHSGHNDHRRSDHRAALLCAVADIASTTCLALTDITGLSAMTIKRGVDELVARHLLIRSHSRISDGNHCAHRISLHPGVIRLILDLTTATMVTYGFHGADPSPMVITDAFDTTMTFEENLRVHVNRGIASIRSSLKTLTAKTKNDKNDTVDTTDTHWSVAVFPPALDVLNDPHSGRSLVSPYLEAYRRATIIRGTRLWDDLAEVVQVMAGAANRPPICALSEPEALTFLSVDHPAARSATVAICLESHPSPHAALLVRRDPTDAWFIPDGSAAVSLKGLREAAFRSLVVPKIVWSHDVPIPRCLSDADLFVRLPFPLRVGGADCRLIRQIAAAE